MEKIAMKCTRAEYETIKGIIGKLDAPSTEDFDEYNYLLNYNDGTFQMYNNSLRNRKIYETFDKDVFLKACGIKVNKVKINLLDVEEALGKDTIVAINTRVKKDKRTKMFKKTIKLLKSFDDLNFDINIIDTQYGYSINDDGKHKRDGSFTITITGNKTK